MCVVKKLQTVHTMVVVVCVMFSQPKQAHVTPPLMELPRLPVKISRSQNTTDLSPPLSFQLLLSSLLFSLFTLSTALHSQFLLLVSSCTRYFRTIN